MKVPFRFNTIFARMFLFNIIMIILATIIPQTVFFNYIFKTYDSDTKTHNLKNAIDMKNNIDDTIIQKVVNIPTLYFSHLHSNDDFIFPLENNITNLPSRILSISQKINDIHNANEFLDSIDIYYKNGNLLFINSNIYFLDDVSAGTDYAYEWITKYKNQESTMSWFTNERINDGVDRNVIAFKRYVPYNANNKDSQAIIVLNINRSYINKYVESYNMLQDEYLMIVNCDDGKIVAHPNSSLVGNYIGDTSLGNLVIESGDRGTSDIKHEDKLITVSYVKSSYNNWKYISVVSIDAMHKKNQQMIIYILVLCIILFIVNIVMSFVFTRGAYRPFRPMLEKVSNISNHFYGNDNPIDENEYNLIDRTINNLAEDIGDLNEKLAANKPIIHHNTISRLIRGDLNLNSIKDVENLIGLSYRRKYIFSYIIKICSEDHLGFENRMFLNYSIIEEVKKIKDDIHVESISNDDKTIAGFINFDMLEQKKDVYEQLQTMIASIIKTRFVLCIGSTYATEGDAIWKSFSEASESYKYFYFMPHKNIVVYEELLATIRGNSKKHVIHLKKLEDSLRSNNEAEYKLTLDTMIGELLAGSYDIDFNIYVLNSIISTIKTVLISMDMDEVNVLGYDMREQMESINNVNEFRIWMNEIFGMISSKRVNEKRSIINNELELKIRAYINENIYNDLSLETISKTLNISSYYLSRNFKVLMGMNLSDYVTEKKMQCAEKLLMNSKLTVKEIAQKLGYNSIQHFIKLFKERYTLTPKEYQKKKLSNDL